MHYVGMLTNTEPKSREENIVDCVNVVFVVEEVNEGVLVTGGEL